MLTVCRIICLAFILCLPQNNSIVAFEANNIVEAQLSYIKQYKDLAIDEMQWSGFPASVKLAQAMLESRHGTSFLARKSNNHFGIKCKIDWEGDITFADDDAPGECFRKYPSVYDSYKDHTKFVKFNRLHFYDHLFEIPVSNYKAWCYGLKKAGYATAPNYAQDLIYYIEEYQLYKYDKAYHSYYVLDEIAKAKPTKQSISKPLNNSFNKSIKAIHFTKNGETLKIISKKYGITLSKLVQLNNVSGTQKLSEGIEIYLN